MRGAETMGEYQVLMPSWDIIQKAHQLGYNEESFLAYREQLDKLDAHKVYNDLQNCVLHQTTYTRVKNSVTVV